MGVGGKIGRESQGEYTRKETVRVRQMTRSCEKGQINNSEIENFH